MSELDSDLRAELGRRLQSAREVAGLTRSQADEALAVGPGWAEIFESGAFTASLDAVLAMLSLYDADPRTFFDSLGRPDAGIYRLLNAEQDGGDLVISWPYGDHDARYRLVGATEAEWRDVLDVMRDGFAANDLSGAVVRSFHRAMALWPHANPSDIWYFVIAQGFVDPFNHPARDARRDWSQSWKRTGGWALERVLVAHYETFLFQHGITIAILPKPQIATMMQLAGLGPEAIPDKADVILYGTYRETNSLLGVVHVKASFAERRTDDVPMSRALIQAGFFSPLWTLDGKAHPSPEPVNSGELGGVLTPGQVDGRSEKRKDFEVQGSFSACFSYNTRTLPTPIGQAGVAAPIVVCDFSNPNDAFSRAVIAAWHAKYP